MSDPLIVGGESSFEEVRERFPALSVISEIVVGNEEDPDRRESMLCREAELIELRESPSEKLSCNPGRPFVSGGTTLSTFTP